MFVGINVVIGGQKKVILKKGSKAPTFILLNLKEKFVKIKDHLNKSVIVVNFWATYCEPCRKEIPELLNMKKEFNDKNLKMFFISIDKEGVGKVKSYLGKNKFKIPDTDVLCDIYQLTAKKYGVEKLPSLFIINKRGRIEYSCVGYKEDNLKRVKRILKKLVQ